MPLQKLQLRPGVNRESTTLSNEGTWFEMDKVRFRSGYPEKIGGWVKDNGPNTSALQPSTGTLWGVCRSLWNWLNLAGFNLMGLGTNLKYYIQNGSGGGFYDVTPLRETATGVANAFTTNTATNSGGQTTLVINDAGHGAQTGDFVTISATSGTVNGVLAANIDGEHQIFRERAARRHVRPGARRDHATVTGSKGPCSFDQLVSGDLRAGGDILRCEAFHGAAQAFESRRLRRDEGAVVPTLADDDVRDAGKNRWVLTGLALQMHNRLARAFGEARVDHDELHSTRERFVQSFARVVLGNAAPFGDHRIGADQHPGIGFREGLRACVPASVKCEGHGLARLVDGAGGEGHGRSQRLHEGARHGAPGGIRKRIGTGIKRDGTRPVLIQNGLQSRGNLVQRRC